MTTIVGPGHRVTEPMRSALTIEQLGHLRHFNNLSRLPVNDWSLMGNRAIGQDDFSSYRYQLAYMIYGAGLTHRHRLPAAPGAVQPMMQRLMTKLLDPEVWLYWKDTSRGHAVFNAHITDTYVEQWDPVVKDNIMYSAYVQSGALMHDYLFDSDRYAQPGSLTFRHWTVLWGGEPKIFEYDRNSLNEHIYWQMVKNGYLGVACEPNCIFQICNQPAIFGFRLHDMITGGDRATEVITNYEKAWEEFGRLDENGHYNTLMFEDSHALVPNSDRAAWVDAWTGTVMHMWNREFVRKNWYRQSRDFVERHDDGGISVRPAPRTFAGAPVDFDWCDFGWVAACATEVGDHATRDGLLDWADAHMSPSRRDGGLYYPRNDTTYDSEGRFVEVDPMVGNVLLGLARLNVEDGLHTMFNEPWGRSHWQEPALTVVDDDIDVSQAEVVDGVLIARVQRRGDVPVTGGTVTLGRVLGRGGSRLEIDGATAGSVRGGELVDARDGLASTDAGLVITLRDNDPHLIVLTPQP